MFVGNQVMVMLLYQKIDIEIENNIHRLELSFFIWVAHISLISKCVFFFFFVSSRDSLKACLASLYIYRFQLYKYKYNVYFQVIC